MLQKNQEHPTRDRSNNSKKVLLILFIAIILITGMMTFFIFQANKYAEKKLLELVNSELSPNALIEIDDFNISFFPVDISIGNLQLRHLTPFEEITPQKQTDRIRTLQINQLSLTGISLWSLLFGSEYYIDRFEVDGILIELVPGDPEELSGSSETERALPITVSELVVNNATVSLYRFRDSDSSYANLNQIAGKFYEFNVLNSTFDELEIEIGKMDYQTSDDHYEVSLESFHLNSRNRQIEAINFDLTPRLSAFEMANSRGYQLDRFDITFSSLSSSQFDVKQWFDHEELKIEKIILSNPSIEIDRDRTLPRREREDRILPFIQFKNLPMAIKVDTFHVENGFLSYLELEESQSREGAISFHDISLTATQLNNHSANDSIFVKANTRFMNDAQFQVNFDLSLNESAGHIVRGTLYGFDLTSLNSTLEQMALMRIESGQLNRLDFWFRADNANAEGNLNMLYDNLEVRFLDAEQQERGRDRIRSFIANTLVLHADNPADDPRIGIIQYERDLERSMFNYWLRSLSTGLEDSIKK